MPTYDEIENPYAAPVSPVPPPGTSPSSTGLEEDDLAAFVGPRADTYLKKWQPALRGYGRAGFNWAAFLFTGLWLPYRKLYRITLVFYGLTFAVGILSELFFVELMQRGESPPELDRLISFAITMAVGMLANGWYLAHARRQIAQVDALGLVGEQRHLELTRRGGTNPLALLVCLVATILIIGALTVLSEPHFNPDIP